MTDDINIINNGGELDINMEQLEQLDLEQLILVFVEQLMVEKGVERSEELKNQLIEKLGEKMNEAVIMKLSDEAVARINAGGVSEEKMMEMVEREGINMEELTEKVMTDFRERYLAEGEEA